MEEESEVKSHGNIILTANSSCFRIILFYSGKLTEDELEALLKFREEKELAEEKRKDKGREASKK